MNRISSLTSCVALVVCTLACSITAHANVSLTGSRIIYDETVGETTLVLTQDGTAPGLVQLWLDDGDQDATPETVNPPFVITPTLAVINPGRQQRVRIVRTRNELPHDRESVLWLNVLEMPREFVEQTSTPTQGDIQPLAFRARVKFFYRPRGLTPAPDRAPDLLQFSLARYLADGRPQIRVYNPSPYHVTFRELELRQTVDTQALAEFNADSPGVRMVAPMSEIIITLDWSNAQPGAVPARAAVSFNIINDYGGLTSGHKALGQSDS